MACDPTLPSKADLQKLKRQAEFIAEVGTSRDENNLPITQATNPDTNETVLTIQGIEDLANEAIETYRRVNAGDYSSGPLLLNDKFTYTTYNGGRFYAVSPPYTTDPTTFPDPNTDTNLVLLDLPDEQFVRDAANQTAEQIVDGEIFPEEYDQSLPLGVQSSSVPVGVTILRVNTGAKIELLQLWEPSGDFSSTTHTVTNVTTNSLGGYDVTSEHGTFEFTDKKKRILRGHNAYPTTTMEIHVDGFGADNTGVVGCADSVIAAKNYAYSLQKNLTGIQAGGSTATQNHVPVLFSPSGYYYFEKTVPISLYGALKCEGKTILSGQSSSNPTPSRSGYYIFSDDVGGSCYQYDFDGFIVTWCQGLVDCDNQNLDQGLVTFKNIEFKGLFKGLRLNTKSTKVVLDNFKSDKCTHTFEIVNCDQITVSRGWVSMGELTDTWDAHFLNTSGTLYMSDVLCVPRPGTAMNTAWINNGQLGSTIGGSVICERVRFGGEPGNLTIVNNWVKFDDTYPIVPSTISLLDCDLYSTDNNTDNGYSCFIRCIQIPNSIKINNCRGGVDTNYYVTYYLNTNPTTGTLPPFNNNWYEQGPFEYDISNNVANIGRPFANISPLAQLFEPDRFRDVTVKDNVLGRATINTFYPIPDSGVYEVCLVDAPNTPASAEYKQTIIGHIVVSTALISSVIQTSVEYTEFLRTAVGTTPNPNALQITVTTVDLGTTSFSPQFDHTLLGDRYFCFIIDGYPVGDDAYIGSELEIRLRPVLEGRSDYIK